MSGKSILTVARESVDVTLVKDALTGWDCAAARLSEDGSSIEFPLPTIPEVALVFAGTDPANAADLCRQLRENPATAKVPILFAIGRYHLSEGNEVRRMGNADFTIVPFDQKDLCSKIERLTGDENAI